VELPGQLLDIILHLDQHLARWTQEMGGWVYVVLFAIVFAETGLVIAPFLPGDSLLFAAGAIAALEGSPLSPVWLVIFLSAAAVLGDAVNYTVGRRIGPSIFHSSTSRLLNRKHLEKTRRFYEKYGGRTIIIARFVPIVRTFAPFVAGIGEMRYARFALYNVTGGIAWVALFVGAGYLFGNLPIVQRNFHVVILAIIVLSVLPIVVEAWRARREGNGA
jgi:membrane-associated protein